MELTPTQISTASFQIVRKGYDTAEVRAFLAQAAKALEEAQQQATAMEARARAAVARLQEVTAAHELADKTEPIVATPVIPVAETTTEPVVRADDAEMISRTLLLAQRTADMTVAEARSEADRLLQEARAESESTIDSTREMSAKLLEEGRAEARKASEEERRAAEQEVQSLASRRQGLVGDVDLLEQFLVDQRDRLRGAAREIDAIVERVPEGLGTVRPPSLSHVDEAPADTTGEMLRPPILGTVPELEHALDRVDGKAGAGRLNKPVS